MHATTADRVVSGILGAALLALALWVIAGAAGPSGGSWDENGAWRLIGAIVMGALGLEALVAAARGRRSLISRVGPLP